MKTMTTMKGFAFAAMMMFAMTASANNNNNSYKKGYSFTLNVQPTRNTGSTVTNHGAASNHATVTNHGTSPSMKGKHNNGFDKGMKHECKCRSCKRVRKALEKHMRQHHYGRIQNRMACRTCMEYSQMLHHNHMDTHGHRH